MKNSPMKKGPHFMMKLAVMIDQMMMIQEAIAKQNRQ
jgi:hypothetical protein